jgi:putative SOS response-associated peptidase YedK
VVSLARSGALTSDGPPATAPSSSARLVIDFDPGTGTRARTGAAALGASHSSVTPTVCPTAPGWSVPPAGPVGTVIVVCGRFSVGRPPGDLAAEFDAEDLTQAPPVPGVPAYTGPDHNVAPGKAIAAVVSRPPAGPRQPRRRELRLLRWGFVPAWSGGPDPGARLINARAETAADKPSFRDALAARRCIVPADGWYEWSGKQPYYVVPEDGSLLALAGLYEFWGTGAGMLVTCAIVTTAAVGPLAAVHERMPLVLPPASWADWLDPAAPPAALLRPPSMSVVAKLEIRPVSGRVGNIANNGPDLQARVEPPAEPEPLF